MTKLIGAAFVIATLLAACGDGDGDAPAEETASTTGSTTTTAASGTPKLTVTSSAFKEGAEIPVKYTCEGEGVSPPLEWSAVPEGTVELALVVDDPDAPDGTFTHWILLDLKAELTAIAEGEVPAGAKEGKNSAGEQDWAPPCPPAGPAHHYRFTVYALDRDLTVEGSVPTSAYITAIESAAGASGRLTALYKSA